MARITSTRERRLWAWALAVVTAIFSAAVFAGSLVDVIGAEKILAIAFASGLVLAIAAVVGLALGRQPRAEGWVALGVAATYLMIGVRAGVPALERTHLFEYGILAVLLYEAMVERKANGAAVIAPWVFAVVGAALLGWVDEAVQSFVPDRVYDTRDVVVNAVAALIAVSAVATLRWGRTRFSGGRAPSGPDAGGASEDLSG
jgi:VanZ like family